MMRIWKVYAQNCTAAEPVKEIGLYCVEEALAELVDYALEHEAIEIDDATDEAYDIARETALDTAEAYFEENGYLGCGDYELVRSEEKPDRPSACSYDTFIFE